VEHLEHLIIDLKESLERELFGVKESLERLWDYSYPGAMINYLQKWMDQLKWQRLAPFEKLAATLLKHLDGIANYCETKAPWIGGVGTQVKFQVVYPLPADFVVPPESE
jgi:transposase